MEVFISWSGDRSRTVAEALHDWLPRVIQSVSPFMSSLDIEKGSRWTDDLATRLGAAEFGLICLTQENLEAPWLIFEAGALSKSIGISRVVPYLYKVPQTQLKGPLVQFQSALAIDKDDTLRVIKSINKASGENQLEPARLEEAFETRWPSLENTLANIPTTTEEAPPARPDSDILEEVLRLCRQISRQGGPNIGFEPESLRNLSTEDSDDEDQTAITALIEDIRLRQRRARYSRQRNPD